MKDIICCHDGELKVNGSKAGNFLRSSKTNSSTPDSGSTSLPPIGTAFMYIETSSNNNSENVFVSFEKTDVIHINNITFYHNKFSSSDVNLRAMGRFRIE